MLFIIGITIVFLLTMCQQLKHLQTDLDPASGWLPHCDSSTRSRAGRINHDSLPASIQRYRVYSQETLQLVWRNTMSCTSNSGFALQTLCHHCQTVNLWQYNWLIQLSSDSYLPLRVGESGMQDQPLCGDSFQYSQKGMHQNYVTVTVLLIMCSYWQCSQLQIIITLKDRFFLVLGIPSTHCKKQKGYLRLPELHSYTDMHGSDHP